MNYWLCNSVKIKKTKEINWDKYNLGYGSGILLLFGFVSAILAYYRFSFRHAVLEMIDRHLSRDLE